MGLHRDVLVEPTPHGVVQDRDDADLAHLPILKPVWIDTPMPDAELAEWDAGPCGCAGELVNGCRCARAASAPCWRAGDPRMRRARQARVSRPQRARQSPREQAAAGTSSPREQAAASSGGSHGSRTASAVPAARLSGSRPAASRTPPAPRRRPGSARSLTRHATPRNDSNQGNRGRQSRTPRYYGQTPKTFLDTAPLPQG
jgi:hypothetical protein